MFRSLDHSPQTWSVLFDRIRVLVQNKARFNGMIAILRQSVSQFGPLNVNEAWQNLKMVELLIGIATIMEPFFPSVQSTCFLGSMLPFRKRYASIRTQYYSLFPGTSIRSIREPVTIHTSTCFVLVSSTSTRSSFFRGKCS